MSDPMESVDFDGQEDEAFAAFPPPLSPGQGGQEGVTFEDPFGNDEESGDVSKLAEVPAAKRKTVKRPQPKLDSNRLTSDRGLPALRTLFDDVQFKGKGHEADDLRLLMKKMENWAHRLYPKMQFEEFIDKVEKLGKKKEVQTCLKRIRLDMPLTHEDYTGEEEPAPEPDVFRDPDPFNEISFPDHLQRPLYSTPAPAAPPAPSPGFSSPPAPALTEEQLRQIELNRQLALERKLARQQQQQTDPSDSRTVNSFTSADETTSVSTANVPNTSKDQEKEVEKAKDMEQVEEGEDVKQMEQVEEMEEVKEMEEVEQVKEIEQVKEMEPVEGADDMTEVKQQVEDSEVEPTGSSSQLPHKDCEPPAESAQSEKEETSSREERRPDNTSEDGD